MSMENSEAALLIDDPENQEENVAENVDSNGDVRPKNPFCDDSDETTNFARLLCLVVEKGTICMKNYVLNHLPHGCNSIDEALQQKRRHFDGLKRNTKFINAQQFNKLYPNGGMPVNIGKIDISLWYILARNLAETTVNGRKFKSNHFQRFETPKGTGPDATEIEAVHDVIRIRNLRNQLFHTGLLPQIDNVTFEALFADISEALFRLGISRNIIFSYKTRCMDPTQTMNYFMEMREQTHLEYQNLYKNEIQKKKYLLVGFVAVSVIVIIVLLVLLVVMFFFTSTWESCLRNQQILYMSGDSKVGSIGFMSRAGWHAKPPKAISSKLSHPLPYVIISNTADSGRCVSTDDCCNTALITQQVGFHRHLDDIAYNFLIGDDGVVYEGRGWDIQSAAAKGWNEKIISIAFMGTYITQPPSDGAIIVTLSFLQYMVDEKILASNFTIYGLCQIRPIPYAPGLALYDNIKTWRATQGTSTWSWRNVTGSYCEADQPDVK